MSMFTGLFHKKERIGCSAVVAAAGSSSRMGGDKLFMDLGGVSVLARTLLALQVCACVEEIVVVTREEKILEVAELCRACGIDKATKILCGGMTRMESVLAGLSEINPDARLVAIHDGARPLVTEEIIREAVHTASVYQCAAPAVPVTDTLKRAENNIVCETLDRSRLVAVQTPQVFVPELVKGALTLAVKNGQTYTDDCAAVEALGAQVHLTEGSPENIKITTPLDLDLALTILQNRRG
jgi:2-C-methyl-D-erythritol 4-phosphate cytidylyltransferase